MLFILVVALLIFGPKRLPELGRTIGKALGEFRRATTDLKRSIDVEMTMAETTSRPPAAAPVAPAVPRTAEPVAADEDEDEDESESAAPADRGDAEDAPPA
jgi:sec-independent protein translocase protein TatB